MAVKLLCLSLLLPLLCLSWADQQTCFKYKSCNECIQSDSQCAWCTGPLTDIHCQSLNGLLRAGCRKKYIYNPQGSMQVVKNDTRTVLTEPLFFQPQEVSLQLRPGVSQSVPLTISMPTDQPITDLTMDISNVPAGLYITFDSTTKGNPQLIQVNVVAVHCPSASASASASSQQNSTGPWSVLITPRGFSLSVKLEITLLCKCSCAENSEENSPACSGNGDLVCGKCQCNAPYIGNHCQVNADWSLSQDERMCHSGPNAPACSGRGTCVEGSCSCEQRADPKERYSGLYCECSNFDCLRHNNRMCGGNGKCECGRCMCDDDWTGDDCSCSMETASCMAKNQQLCNGRGLCECGTCRCEPPYGGPTCEECPVCSNTCQQHASCVECRAFRTGDKMNTCDTECSYLTVITWETTDKVQRETEKLCKMRTHDGACFMYTISSLPSGGRSTLARVKKC